MSNEERNAIMEGLYLNGETLEAVGNKYGISRERVRQILHKRGVDPGAGGAVLARKLKSPKVKVSKKIQCPEGFHYCRKCQTMDSIENFYHIKRKEGGTTYIHKPCRNEYMKQYLSRGK